MKSRSIFYAGLIGLTACSMASAAQVETRANQWELGPEIYYSEYKEPAFNVKIDGVMYGIVGAFTHHDPNYWMFKADGHAAWGEMDYHSTASGSINGIDDYLLEGAVAAGYEVHPKEGMTFTPFFGIAYRYLNDDSSGKISSTGARGYERESNYFYSPVGAELSTKLNDGWTLGLSGEYDIFWSGEQKSHLGGAISGLNTITNNQDNGYGVRGSVKLRKKGETFDILIEPFVRWWSVKDSQTSNITFSGVIVGYAYEPKNETLEVGGKIAFIF